MNFTFHTTKKSERDMLMAQKGKHIIIRPEQFHKEAKAIVWEEGTEVWYEHTTDEFMELLQIIENDGNVFDSRYYKKWEYKGTETETRINNLARLLADIKRNGIINAVHCEITGERLDGSYRTKIAMYLGIPEVSAILHKFRWQDIDEEFIERKIKARNLAFPKDYYEFKYGYKDWKNIESGGAVYKENAERWEVIAPLVTGKRVLDLGCNEGYISIQLARNGHSVVGVDKEWIQNAWLNKLIFEWIDKKDIPVEFYEEDILETNRKADTILFLNVLYHLPKDKQKDIILKYKGRQMVFQCNLRKEKEREAYYTSHPEDLGKLLTECGIDYKIIDWRDKPIVVTI